MTTKFLLLLAASSSLCHGFVTPAPKLVKPSSSLNLAPDFLDSVSHLLADAADAVADVADAVAEVAPVTDVANVIDGPAAGEVSYSKASYYTVLGLYLFSFPGLWSTIKRSTKAKVKRKTFVTAGEAADGGKSLRQQAGEIMAYMKANNYEVVDAGETIKFRGVVQRSTSQAFFLVFCTALAFLSLGLVLQIQFQDLELPVIGHPNWYLLTLASPYAGVYYWGSGDRVDDYEVKLEANDEDTENEITVEGSDEEMERMWRTLEWQEKGMVKVEGIL